MKIKKATLIGYLRSLGIKETGHFMIPLYKNGDSYYHHRLDEKYEKIVEFNLMFTHEQFEKLFGKCHIDVKINDFMQAVVPMSNSFIKLYVQEEFKIGDPAVFVWEGPIVVTSKADLEILKAVATKGGYKSVFEEIKDLPLNK